MRCASLCFFVFFVVKSCVPSPPGEGALSARVAALEARVSALERALVAALGKGRAD